MSSSLLNLFFLYSIGYFQRLFTYMLYHDILLEQFRRLIMANIQELNENTFKTQVLDSNQLTVVDFYAPWCGPCRKMADVLAQIAEDYSGKINIYKLNTDENIKIAQEFSISSLPSILLFKEGQAKERLVGLMPKSSIVNNIEKYL